MKINDLNFTPKLSFSFLFICFWVLFLPKTNSQNLSYFILGEKELRSTEIYSVLQTKDQRLYVATNEGLYEYKYDVMNKIKRTPTQIGSSLFNLVANSKNEVFCANLNGQIFKVESDRLVLFSQIPSKYLREHITIAFDEHDILYMVSRNCLRVTKDSIEVIYSSNQYPSRGLTKLPDGRIFLAIRRVDSLIQINNGKLIPVPSHIDSLSIKSPSYVYSIQGDLVLSNELDALPNKYFDLVKVLKSNFYEYRQFSDQKIWRRLSTSGIELIKRTNTGLEVVDHYFKEYFISSISSGMNGTLFLGTFGEGLIVVPNTKTKRHYLKGLVKNIQSIAVEDSGTIYLSDKKNGLLHYKDEEISFHKNRPFTPEQLFKVNGKVFGISEPSPSKIINANAVEGALKNVSLISDSTYLLSTSLGVSIIGDETIINDSLWDNNYLPYKAKYFTPIKERCTDAIYSKLENALYISTISSLIKFQEKQVDTLLFRQNLINANDLLLHKDLLLVATQDSGILFFRSGKFLKQLSTKNGLENNCIRDLKKDGELLFISHKSGIQIYNLTSQEWQNLGKMEGIDKVPVQDISVANGLLWIANKNYLSSFPYKELSPPKSDYIFGLDSIKIFNKHLSKNHLISFPHQENQLHIYPSFRGVLYESEAFYQYSISNFDKGVHQTPVTQKKITYDFLPPGDYTFSINILYRNVKSKPIQYSFTIEPAFWQSPWIYIIIALFAIAFISLALQYRNRKMQKRNNEQLESQLLKTNAVESELKALRSQMNPHFIFNSLNSIQDLVLQEDTDASYDSIVLFSELVRNALNYSNQNFISIKQEIEFLEAYLKLEKLRFGEDFTYEIKYEGKLSLKIPSLIIQPFVENAVVHGLFHTNKEKILSIEFALHENVLECKITDNGIGRKKAKEIEQRKGKEHFSFALNAIQKRLDILKSQYEGEIGFHFMDLEDASGSAVGTSVTVYLPYLS